MRNYNYSQQSNFNNVIAGIRLRALRILQSLQNIDYSQYPELQSGADTLNRIVNNQVNALSLWKNRSKLYNIFSQMEYGLGQMNSYNVGKVYSGVSRGVSQTMSGLGAVPVRKAKPGISKGIKQKNSKLVGQKDNSGINVTDYLPYLIIGGILLFVMFSGYKTVKRK